MGKSFSSLKDLENYLQSKINDVLQHETSDAVKDEIQSSISDTVYTETPTQYVRRNLKNGSLGDKNTMSSELITDGVLEVSPDADFNHQFASTHNGYGGVNLDKSLAFNIEYGYGSKSHWYDIPRPFVEESKENLKKSKAHIESMRDGLIKRGLDIL